MVGHTVLLVVVIGAIVWQSDRVITGRLERALNVELADEVTEYRSAAASRPPDESLATFSRAYLESHPPGRNLLLVLGTRAAPALTSPRSAFLTGAAPVRRWIAHPPGEATLVTYATASGTYRMLGAPVHLDGRHVVTFVAAADLTSLNPDRNEQLAIAALEGLGALVAAVAGGYYLLRRVLRTVNRVTEAAREARGGDFAHRLSYGGPDDEVGRLARTMDDMLAQLDASFTAHRQLLANVSHQLRTPLTVALGHLEVLARAESAGAAEQSETVALVIDELAQMSLMVQRVLLLGQALEPDFLLEEEVELPALLEEVFDAARVMAPRKWSLGPVPDLQVRVDRSKLRGALLNIVDNAVKATSETDAIALTATLGTDLVLEVADTGRGIPAAEQAAVFDRFRRSPTSRYTGSGLGLAIAKAVAEGHHGEIALSSAPGRGTTVRIVLPAGRVRRAPRALPAPNAKP